MDDTEAEIDRLYAKSVMAANAVAKDLNADIERLYAEMSRIFIGMYSEELHPIGLTKEQRWKRDREKILAIMCYPLCIERAKQSIWLNRDLIRLLQQYL